MEFAIVLVFCSIATLVFAVGGLTAHRSTRQRLERLAATGGAGDRTAAAVAASQVSALGESLVSWVGTLFEGSPADSSRRSDSIRQRLVEADYRHPSAFIIYTTTRLTLALTLPLVALGLSSQWYLDSMQLLTVLTAAVVTGLVLPSQWVDRRRAARQQQIIFGLPDALDLMVVCVEAGLGIQACLSRIAGEFRRTNPTLSDEFERVTLETRAGKSTTDALRALARRSGVTDVSSLVAMLVQTERFGTSLADTLRVQADAMRVARMQRAEEQAGKAPLKMMFPTLLIFAATLLVTLGPGMLQLMSFFESKR